MKAYLGLGSNLGDKFAYLKKAVSLINQSNGIKIEQKSSFYETEPYGYHDQDKFINAVILIETSLAPEELLHTVNKIESQLDRTREIHWGPRTIDIDILLMENTHMETQKLTIPHKELEKRAFVLIPLQEIYLKENLFNLDINLLLQGNQDVQTVKKLDESW